MYTLALALTLSHSDSHLQDMAKRTERLAAGPVPGTKGFHEPMTRTPPAHYPKLGGKVLSLSHSLSLARSLSL